MKSEIVCRCLSSPKTVSPLLTHSRPPPLPNPQWLTGEEKDNVGYIIFRKRADSPGAEFEEVASFKTFPPLNTKGPEGGFYSYVDEGVEPGQYVYRITDQDKASKRTLLCQSGVEVQAPGEKLRNTVVLAFFGALVLGGVVASFLYEPLQ